MAIKWVKAISEAAKKLFIVLVNPEIMKILHSKSNIEFIRFFPAVTAIASYINTIQSGMSKKKGS